jgi:hypothetical protein
MKNFTLCLTLSSIMLATGAQAATKHHRLVWDNAPANRAVIGFSPDGNSNSPYVKYGYSTVESAWSTANVTATETFAGSLTSHFVHLNGLTADAAVYYRVCDNDGCGQRFWFKTAAIDNQSFVAVAGGDTRSGWTTRREGNALVAKIRPLFVMHGGDYTNSNNASEMNEFLSDWALTYSNDTIDGIAYKRIYPMVATHGNHEDNNYLTLCQAFGVDYNLDGQCTASDTYGAVQVSPLLRVYTLNSQFQNSGWSSYASAMNTWLANDLSTHGGTAQWRFAQYHKPLFPHYSGKSDNLTLFGWWADHFYNHGVNLVVESDTHINKLTTTVKPSGSSLAATTNGGTVFVGEGSWGAPARSANDPKSWTLDLASIQQFKVLSVSSDKVEVRTAQFDGSAATLTLAQRATDPLLLPTNVNWWQANGVGESLNLLQDSAGRTILAGGDTGGGTGGNSQSVTLSVTDDTFIGSNQANNNFNASSEGLLADGSDKTYGTMDSLLKWDLSNIAGCSTITSVTVEVDVFDASSGTYNLLQANNSWSEASATWNSVGGTNNRGTVVGSFVPSGRTVHQINLNANGISMVQGWLSGNNNGLVVASGGSNNGIDFDSKEIGNSAKLLVTYDDCSSANSVSLNVSDDSFISSTLANDNFDGSVEGILADGVDSVYGEANAMFKWDLSAVPSCAVFTGASIEVNVFNPTPGSYNVFASNNDWNEQTLSWNSVGGSANRGALVASFSPASANSYSINLNANGLSMVQSWLSGNNNGVVMASSGTTDGIDMDSKETGSAEKLVLAYEQCQ